MSGFQLDTSGCVDCHTEYAVFPHRWSDLTPFCQGYVEAMLGELRGQGIYDMSRLCPSCRTRHLWTPGPGQCRACDASLPEGSGLGFRHLAPATLSRIIADCELVAERTGWTQLDEAAGREAWRLRQECTAFYGLWPLTVTLGDDGLVYLTEAGQ